MAQGLDAATLNAALASMPAEHRRDIETIARNAVDQVGDLLLILSVHSLTSAEASEAFELLKVFLSEGIGERVPVAELPADLSAQLNGLVGQLPPRGAGEVRAFADRITAGEAPEIVAQAIRQRMQRLVNAVRDRYLSREDAHERVRGLRAALAVVATRRVRGPE